MKLKHFLVVAFAFVAGMASAQQMPAIPIDPNVRIGKLDNGLTYYIRHNNWPENVANFYIAQRVGSIQEEESQRGLAHFLEHMAFNGSEHFPDSTLLEYTRSLGVEFGSDLNAYTGIDQTVYRICNVPTKRQTALDSCLLILRDWSNGLTLVDKEIDQERGVIHQEWQMRTSASMRIFERTLPLQYPGSKYGERLPIGLMSVVDNFKYNELRDYYHKWYHPGNQAIIVVGNIDVDHTEAEIKRLWSDVKKLENATPVVDVPVPDNDKAIYIFDKDKELQQSSITIAMKHDPVDDKAKETVDYLLENYAKTMISMMLNQRFSEMTQKEDCPFFGSYAYDGQYIYSKRTPSTWLVAPRRATSSRLSPPCTARPSACASLASPPRSTTAPRPSISPSWSLPTRIATRSRTTSLATSIVTTTSATSPFPASRPSIRSCHSSSRCCPSI